MFINLFWVDISERNSILFLETHITEWLTAGLEQYVGGCELFTPLQMCVRGRVHADPADVKTLAAPLLLSWHLTICVLCHLLMSSPLPLVLLFVQSMLMMKFSRAVPKAFLISFTGEGGDEIESSHAPLFDAALLLISSWILMQRASLILSSSHLFLTPPSICLFFFLNPPLSRSHLLCCLAFFPSP